MPRSLFSHIHTTLPCHSHSSYPSHLYQLYQTHIHICIFSLSKALYIYYTHTYSQTYTHTQLYIIQLSMSSIWRACCSQGEGAPLPGGPIAERNHCQGCGQGLWAGRMRVAGFARSLSGGRTLLQPLNLLGFSSLASFSSFHFLILLSPSPPPSLPLLLFLSTRDSSHKQGRGQCDWHLCCTTIRVRR